MRWTHGPSFGEGGISFRLWAPGEKRIELVIEGRAISMTRGANGFHEAFVERLAAGARYRFALADGRQVPDPASRSQPEGVNGPSEAIDPGAYRWRENWQGRQWNDIVLYELHIGAFSPEGTFAGAAQKLDHLAALGVTAVEIMPISAFGGRWNWGYDGAFCYAPDANYGRPGDFKAFVEAAHQRGIAVLLDVVYSHFGPEGNFVPLYAPEFFTSRHRTPWGEAIQFDGPNSRPVRDFFIENAEYWIEEFHLDGLRLDAVHAIKDDTRPDLLDELAQRLRSGRQRPVHLLLENEDNEPRRLTRSGGEPERYTAQWNDDMHHVLHVAATRESSGYYAAYGRTELLGRALAEGFAYQGEMMPYRGAPRGGPSRALPPGAFVSFIQNHDQIGNRAFGERLNTLVPPEVIRALASIYLLAPQTPMIFMGEEWGATKPFSVLLRLQRKTWGGRPQGTARRILAFSGVRRSGTGGEDSRPDGGDNVPFVEARLELRRRRSSGLLSCIARGATRKGPTSVASYRARRRGVRAGRASSAGRVAGRRSLLLLDANLSLTASSARRSQAKFSGVAARPKPSSDPGACAGESNRRDRPARDLPLAASRGLRLQPGGRHCALPRAARRQPRLSLPNLQGAARQRARL